MTVKELIADLSKYDGDLVIKANHVTSDGMEDAQYKIAYIAEESLTVNLVITLKDKTAKQRPSECKPKCKDCEHCRKWGYDYVCYDYRQSISGYIVSPYRDACHNYEPKEEKDNGR